MESTVREAVCSFSNLYSAMKKSRRNVMWKDSVARYLANALVNIYKLKKSLDEDSYKISPYTHFKVYEPKERNIVSTRMNDRVFQRSLCDNYFYDTMTKSDVDSCYQSWKAHVSNGKNKTHRDTHNVILAMDQYYKKLWTEVN